MVGRHNLDGIRFKTLERTLVTDYVKQFVGPLSRGRITMDGIELGERLGGDSPRTLIGRLEVWEDSEHGVTHVGGGNLELGGVTVLTAEADLASCIALLGNPESSSEEDFLSWWVRLDTTIFLSLAVPVAPGRCLRLLRQVNQTAHIRDTPWDEDS